MRFLKYFLIFILTSAVVGAAGFVFFGNRGSAEAVAPDETVDEPVQRAAQASEPPKEDSRLAGLPPRSDGARLLWVAPEKEKPVAAGFADNQAIVITATSTAEAGATHLIFAVDLGSGSVIRQIDGPGVRYASSHRMMNANADKACWSAPADGTALEIWCADHAWKSPKRLTTHDGGEDFLSAAISPDGGWVAFEVNNDRASAKSKKTGASAIWKIGLNGAGLQQLTRGADDRNPTWSEDGQRMYFQRRLPDGNWDIYGMGADGSDPEPILRTIDQNELWPTRVPGTGIIVSVVESASATPRVKAVDMTTKAGEYLTGDGLGPETSVSVSPDGKLISFLAPVDSAKPGVLGLWLKEFDWTRDETP